jgi:hypothetical protein
MWDTMVTWSALMDSGFHVDTPTGRPLPFSKPWRAGGTTRGMVSLLTVLPFGPKFQVRV